MIDWLEIRQLAIAERIALEFGASFTAVTGETGSGKSLIVDALGILLGGRCDNSVIRQRQGEAEVQGGFAVGDGHPAARWLRAHDLGADGECVLRRVVRRERPNRAFINGRAVNAADLRALGRELADIHGQNEHHSLLRRGGQLALLDGAADNVDRLARLGECHARLSATQTRIDALRDLGARANERADLLRFQIDELQKLAPQEDEWPRLEQQQKRMHHAQDLTAAAADAARRLRDGDDDNTIATLTDCAASLQRLAQYDPRLAPIVALLESAQINLAEAADQLRAVCDGAVLDPDQMAEIEARFSLYHELSRKHRVLPGLLAPRLAEMRAELATLQDPQAELANLQAQQREHRAQYDKLADAIGTRRATAAKRLSAEVTALMQDLGMAGGGFEIRLQPRADHQPTSPRGNERAEFFVSANPGLPLQPLGKVASGGEVSRISLAINVVLAASAPASTLIFDEVDVGIGGKVAEIVGQKLRQLGDSRQVICITHLSQVAAKGHHHWSVQKRTGREASVSVRPLDHPQRIEEIARMTAGAELTPQSLAHAERLLQSA
ncbi:MAG: DNA repair protein RecN [bacterium]